MRELTPTAVLSESPGGGGKLGECFLSHLQSGKKVPESGLCYGVQ